MSEHQRRQLDLVRFLRLTLAIDDDEAAIDERLTKEMAARRLAYLEAYAQRIRVRQQLDREHRGGG